MSRQRAAATYQAAGTYVTSVTGTSPIVSSGGTTPAISIPAATSSVNGYLSATDWTTFNNKQSTLTNPVTGTGTINYIAKFTATGSTIGNSSIADNGAGRVSIGTASFLDNFVISNGGTTGWEFSNTGSVITYNRSTSAFIPMTFQASSFGFTGAATFSSSVTATQLITKSASGSAALFLKDGSAVNKWEIGHISDALYFYNYTNNTEPMRITSGGNVLIGTTTDAGYKLDVNGTVRVTGAATFSNDVTVSSASTNGFIVNSTSGASFRGFKIQHNGSTNAGFEADANTGQIKIGGYFNTGDYFPVIYSDGVAALTFGIGASPSATFVSLGTGTVTASSGTLSTVSDSAYKIADGFIEDALTSVMNLKPRYFYWKDKSGLDTTIRQLGFYAQEVNSAIGEEAANTPKENNPWGITDRSLIAFLTKAIQELSVKNEALIKRIEQLENK